MSLTDRRAEKMEAVIRNRQPDIGIFLENVHDKHNIGAVLRTCDSIGVTDVYVLYTMEGLSADYFKAGQKASSGAIKWVRLHFFSDRDKCFEVLRKRYDYLCGTHLGATSHSLYDLDLTGSVLLAFGNEHAGLTEETLAHLDGNFVIPQYGMVQSLNISVACAVTLYEVARQRIAADMYPRTDVPDFHQEISDHYTKTNKIRERMIIKDMPDTVDRMGE